MKPANFLLALAILPLSAASGVEVGDSLAEVRGTLGVPRGEAVQEGKRVLYYDEGEVELLNGAVTRVALRTPEEQAVFAARAEQARAEREERRARLIEEGTALRDRKLADANLKEAPLAYQVSFWEDLARRYPDVSMSEPLTIARMRLAEVQAKERKEAEAVALQLAERQEREERMAAMERATTVYPLFTGTRYSRFRPYYAPGLGPITYTFFSSPLPPYTTPSGNPAGNLTGPVVNLPTFNPVQPLRVETPQAEERDWRHRGFDRRGNDGL